MTTSAGLLQVFEYQFLYVGKQLTVEQFEQLASFSEKHHSKYFSLIHNGIRFSHYVGAIQVGNLTIEILPKADKISTADKRLWQSVLLDMLRQCNLIKLDTLTSANLSLKSNSLLDYYYEVFVKEVEKLMQEGFIKSYHRIETNLKVLKGRLILPKQLRKNPFHKERFFTNHEQYNFNHKLNQIIHKALHILIYLVTDPDLSFKVQKLITYFPPIAGYEFSERDFQNLLYNRQTIRYQNAIEIARMLILKYRPDIRGGKNNLVAILFDMNLLFEEYVFRQLKKLQNEDLIVKRQQQKAFWNRRYLRPDILLNYKGKNMIIDTKWKALKKVMPGMEDLRQAFVYNQFFNSEKCVLVFPKIYELSDMESIPFENLNGKNACQICFVDVLKNKKLDKDLGTKLLARI